MIQNTNGTKCGVHSVWCNFTPPIPSWRVWDLHKKMFENHDCRTFGSDLRSYYNVIIVFSISELGVILLVSEKNVITRLTVYNEPSLQRQHLFLKPCH